MSSRLGHSYARGISQAELGFRFFACVDLVVFARTRTGVVEALWSCGVVVTRLAQAVSRGGFLIPEPHRESRSATVFSYDLITLSLKGRAWISQLQRVSLSIVETVCFILVKLGSKRKRRFAWSTKHVNSRGLRR